MEIPFAVREWINAWFSVCRKNKQREKNVFRIKGGLVLSAKADYGIADHFWHGIKRILPSGQDNGDIGQLFAKLMFPYWKTFGVFSERVAVQVAGKRTFVDFIGYFLREIDVRHRH